ncbi:NAD(P)H-binding protein [Sorangium sp. So ce1078]|uniref:NAD(P)H-binding protein n=1 Tax=Sorangium sp. So ce1078 TaxID=3133329 RepID=UPI003F61FEE5
MATPSILVFGATGKIGGALIDELLPDHAAGRVKLIAAVRRPEAAAAFEARGLETRLIDLDLAETQGIEAIVGAMRGVDRVLSAMRAPAGLTPATSPASPRSCSASRRRTRAAPTASARRPRRCRRSPR